MLEGDHWETSYMIRCLLFLTGMITRCRHFFIDSVEVEITHLVASVCVCVRLSVGALLFEPFNLG